MSVTFCILGLGAVIIYSWYSFLLRLADFCEERREEKQLERDPLQPKAKEASPFDSTVSDDCDAA